MGKSSRGPEASLTRISNLEGESYRAARDEFLANASAESWKMLRTVASRTVDHASDWRRIWIARAIVAWNDSPQVCLKVTRYMRGELDHRGPCPSAAGAWDGPARADDIAALGPGAIPRVVEMLIATRDFRDDDGLQLPALILALNLAPELEPLFIDRLRADPSTSVRMAVAGWMGEHPSPALDTELVAAITATSHPWSLRAECLSALGARGELDTVLTRIIKEDSEAPGLEAAAISALARRNAPAAVELALAALPAELRIEISARYLDVVRRHGGANDRVVLEAVAASHPSPIIRAKAARAVEDP